MTKKHCRNVKHPMRLILLLPFKFLHLSTVHLVVEQYRPANPACEGTQIAPLSLSPPQIAVIILQTQSCLHLQPQKDFDLFAVRFPMITCPDR